MVSFPIIEEFPDDIIWTVKRSIDLRDPEFGVPILQFDGLNVLLNEEGNVTSRTVGIFTIIDVNSPEQAAFYRLEITYTSTP